MAKFTSIAEPTTALYKEKGSKFLAFAFPVQNLEEINARLEELRIAHPKARHHCYAYKLGTSHPIMKANDDGEPSNSAGTPILNQIRSAELTNILVVVVRYFGGTKLGIPGLIQAYKTAAADSLKIAILAEDFEKEQIALLTTYHKLSELQNFLKKRNVIVVAQEFNDTCILRAAVAIEDASNLKKKLLQLPFIQILP
ncbi:MAG: YigZ family protein [Sphingobacteriales bacterium]|nr:MAG: YigZ family protein [Sphingobacteriales bacterium]